jgi:hypothetical protein
MASRTTRIPRRALFSGGLVGFGGVLAVQQGNRANAEDGDPVLLGADNVSPSRTTISNAGGDGGLAASSLEGGTGVLGHSTGGSGVIGTNTIGGAPAVFGVSGGPAPGVKGTSARGSGVEGESRVHERAAISATSRAAGTGLLGISGAGNTPRLEGKAKTGVYGQALQDGASRGVWGRSNDGRGVFGEARNGVGVFGSSTTGIGVFSESADGFALRTRGRIRFGNVSGQAIIPAGRRNVILRMGVPISPSSFLLLTPMTDVGSRCIWFTKNRAENSVTLHISSSRTTPTRIAWLLLN